jgi:hypothetical protein
MSKGVEITLVFALTPEEVVRFQGHSVLMITPIQKPDISGLKVMYLGVRDFLAFNARTLATLNETLESGNVAGARTAVARLLADSRQTVLLSDTMLQTLGRSVFVGGEHGSVTEGTVQ